MWLERFLPHRPRPTVLVRLLPRNGYRVFGTALLRFVGRRRLQVLVRVHGLVPRSIHPDHIHLGFCGSMGPIAHPLVDLVAGRDGTATAATVVRGVSVIPAVGWYINVHLGPTLADGGSLPVACGNISLPAPVVSPSVRMGRGGVDVVMVPQAGSGVTGTARLSVVRGGGLRASLRLTGLPPGARYQAYINYGACGSAGPLAYPLPDLSPGLDGSAAADGVIPDVDSIPPQAWSVRVQAAGDGGGEDAPVVACGDVVPDEVPGGSRQPPRGPSLTKGPP